MNTKTRKESIDCIITDTNADVSLTITIGNAQIGGNIIKWSNSSDIIKKGDINNLNLGIGKDIKGKNLNITTNIVDVNDSSNGIVATYDFTNISNSTVSFEDTVDNDGDVFSLQLNINFK